MTVDGWVGAPTDGVHLPVGVVVVDDVEVTVSAPWHSLDEAGTEVVEGNRDLHYLVLFVRITMPQQHHLVVVGEVIVGDGDGGGSHDGVDESIGAVCE